MATQVRALPEGGWIVVDDTETFVRALPDGGWLVQEGAGGGATANPWYYLANEAIVQ